MNRVVGLDLSLTRTGVAVVTRLSGGTCRATALTVTSTGRTRASIVDRSRRVAELAEEILHSARMAELVVVEGMFAVGAKGGALIDRAGLFHRVVSGLVRADVPIALVAPTSLKLAIAGKGNADKAALAVALTRLWPDVDVTSSDVSDAMGLAHLGAVHLGWPVQTLERHRQCKAEWPELLDQPTTEVA